MKSHVWRPLFVVLAVVAAILIAREFLTPKDFGVQEQGYRFGWHRKSNEQEWKEFKVKFAERDYCAGCHADKAEAIAKTPHAIINCQNCHGPALEHPDNPPKLAIDRSRALCLRCHARLGMKGSARDRIKSIVDAQHNTGNVCADCHNPHSPSLN